MYPLKKCYILASTPIRKNGDIYDSFLIKQFHRLTPIRVKKMSVYDRKISRHTDKIFKKLIVEVSITAKMK